MENLLGIHVKVKLNKYKFTVEIRVLIICGWR